MFVRCAYSGIVFLMMIKNNFSWLATFQWLAVIAFADPAEIVVDSPLDFQVIQRTAAGSVVDVRGVLPVAADLVEGRLGDAAWQKLVVSGDGRLDFEGSITSPAGGWYRLELRARLGEEIVAEANVAHVGVGEVFVIAGQSNSANHGGEKQRVALGRALHEPARPTARAR